MSTLDLAPATRRVTRLARSNGLLMVRNRLTLGYALVMPLLPLAMLFLGDRGSVEAGASGITTALIFALMFPIFYNLLSMVVARRDELVLKRLRTGEVRDSEILLSMALPGVVITLVITLLTVVVAMITGLRFPANPVLLLVTVLLACAAFAGLALWTAAWTKTAEAAQMTSMPVILLATVGLLKPIFPEAAQQWVSLLPGTALLDLVHVTWFARSAEVGSTLDLSFADTWVQAGQPLAVLAAWTVLAVVLAQRSMRWEPRA